MGCLRVLFRTLQKAACVSFLSPVVPWPILRLQLSNLITALFRFLCSYLYIVFHCFLLSPCIFFFSPFIVFAFSRCVTPRHFCHLLCTTPFCSFIFIIFAFSFHGTMTAASCANCVHLLPYSPPPPLLLSLSLCWHTPLTLFRSFRRLVPLRKLIRAFCWFIRSFRFEVNSASFRK